jgi:predicted esterase YcpF (UPF0227 family)
MTTTHLLYLHGFRSSPQSAQARQTAAYVAPSPRAAMDLVAQGIAHWPGAAMGVVGSSLGGFYASWVAQHKGCRSVLLNPAVHPARDLERYIGEQTAWHDPAERFYFKPDYIDELRALDISGQAPAAPEMAIIAKGDEVLDWREMVARYPHAQQVVQEGGEHALANFSDYLPRVAAFLALA